MALMSKKSLISVSILFCLLQAAINPNGGLIPGISLHAQSTGSQSIEWPSPGDPSLSHQPMHADNTAENRRFTPHRAPTNQISHYLTPNEHSFIRPIIPDFQVNPDRGTVDQRRPVVVSDTTGNFIVLWYDERNGTPDVYAQRYDKRGNPIGDNYRINQKYLITIGTIEAHMNAGGNFIAIWDRSPGLGYRIFHPDGSPATDERILIPRTHNGLETVFLLKDVALTEGNAAIFLGSKEGFNNGNMLTGYRLNEEGVVRDSVDLITPDEGANITGCSVVVNAENVVLIGWSNSATGQVFIQLFTETLTPLTSPRIVDTVHGGFRNPRLAVLDDSTFVAAWEEIINRGNRESMEIHGRIISVNGDMGREQTFLTNEYILGFQIAPHPPDDITVSWADSSGNLFARQWDEQEQIAGPVRQINLKDDVVRGSYYRDIRMTGRHHRSPVFVWTDQRGEKDDIYLGMEIAGRIVNLKVNDDVNSGHQIDSDIAVAENGDFIIVWEDHGAGLVARRFTENGTPRGDSFILEKKPEQIYNANPVTASNGSGDFAVTWKSSLNSLKLHCLPNSGTSAMKVTELQASGKNHVYGHAIDMDNMGRIIIVWSEYNDATSAYEIRGQFISPRAKLSDGRITISDTEKQGWKGLPDVAFNSEGEFVVTWEYQHTDTVHCYFRRYGRDGTPLGTINEVVESDHKYWTAGSRVGVDRNDNITITYRGRIPFRSEWRVYYQRFTSAGVRLGPPKSLEGVSQGLSVNRGGDYLRYSFGEVKSGDHDVLIGQWGSFDGNFFSDPFRLTVDPGRRQLYAEAVLRGNRIYSTWTDSRDLGHGYNIYANILEWIPSDSLPSPFGEGTELLQSYPNPFNTHTTIRYQLEQAGRVTLTIYDISGHRVTTLVDQRQPVGEYVAYWAGMNDHGIRAGTGIYFARFRTHNMETVMKLMLIR